MTGGLELFAHDPMPAEEVEERLARINVHVDEMWPDVIAIYQGRGWLSLGYASFKELCDDRMRVRPALAVDERQPLVQTMTDAGMSIRAIGSALGVTHPTVLRDQASGGTDLPPVTKGLDGKDYTRPTPADPAAQTVTDYLDADPEISRAKLRHQFSTWMHSIHRAHLFDPEQMAEIYPDADLDYTVQRINEWFTTYKQSLQQQSTLRLVPGRNK